METKLGYQQQQIPRSLKHHRMLRISKVRRQVRPSSLVTAELSRGARGLLRWTQQYASVQIGIAITTLAEFEASESVPHSNTLESIESVYRSAGVTFINDADRVGVLLDRSRLIKKSVR